MQPLLLLVKACIGHTVQARASAIMLPCPQRGLPWSAIATAALIQCTACAWPARPTVLQAQLVCTQPCKGRQSRPGVCTWPHIVMLHERTAHYPPTRLRADCSAHENPR